MRRALAAALLAPALLAPALALADAPLRTPGGEVRARAPGAGWSCGPERRAGDGFVLAELRCRRATADGDLLLYAKDYQGPKEDVARLCARDWRASHGALFESVARRRARVVGQGAGAVCELDLEGTAVTGARVRVLEWYATPPGHLLVVSAAGPAELVAARLAEVRRWREGVVFAARPGR